MKQNPYKRFARALAAVEKWIIVVALAIGVALTAVNVVCRYIFKANVNFSWSEEVVVALLVLTYMVGAALCSSDYTPSSRVLIHLKDQRNAQELARLRSSTAR